MLLVLSATLAGADDFVETVLWGREHMAFLRRFRPHANGIPSHEVDWLFPDRRYPGEPVFPGLAMIGRIKGGIERGGEIKRETRHYLCSAPLDAWTFSRAVRAHWGVENGLHWVLDVVFHEDLARLRTGNAPQNMAIIRHTALNFLSRARPTTSLKNRRKRAGWNPDYLDHVIRQTT